MGPHDFSLLCAWAGLARHRTASHYRPTAPGDPARAVRRSLRDRLGRVMIAGGIALHDFGRWLSGDDFRLGRPLPNRSLANYTLRHPNRS